MKKTTLLRAFALMLCLALLGSSCLAEASSESAALDVVVEEESEFALGDDASAIDGTPLEDTLLLDPDGEHIGEGDGTDADTPEGTEEGEPETPPVGETEEGEPETPPADEPEEQDDPTERSFYQTETIESETWKNVNLVHAKDFTKPLAQVRGKLKLVNVQIDGKPAREADLSAYFTLGPTGSIAIEDDNALSLNLSMFSINKGKTKTLTATWNGSKVSSKKVEWTTSNKDVAKVSRGEISAKKAGTAVITATYKGVSTTCLVVVTNHKQVKSLKLNKTKVSLALNATMRLKLTIEPSNAFEPGITWKSSKPSVVSVDQDGWIAGLADGKATITVTSANGKKATCKVTVKEIKPTSVSLGKTFVSLHPGDSYATTLKIKPSDVSNPSISYTSSDPEVATVDEDGVITAVGCGKARITAKADANGKTGFLMVSVYKAGSKRLEGLVIGINPGHQKKTISKLYPLAPGSREKGKGVKTGACGRWTRVNEYETNLQIGLKLRDMLEAEGATVVMTRTSNDVMLTNIDRAKMLNKAGVDVALQLHCNGSSNTSRNGCIGYIRTTTEYADTNRAIAKALTNAIGKRCGCVNHGVKTHNSYMSLNWTTTPSVLLEMGYISNRKEDKLLASDAYRTKMAAAIMEGLCDYFGR